MGGNMSRIFHPLLAAVFALSFLGCGKDKKADVQPAKKIEESFAVMATPPPVASGDLAVDKFLVGIKRTALEKEFLMRTEMVTQALAPSFQGLRSRIIAFREHGEELLM